MTIRRTLIWTALAVALAPTVAVARDFAIGGGVTVTLGNDWNGTTLENPAMGFPGMTDVMAEATETRLHGGSSGILVSYMRFKTDKAAADVQIDDGALLADTAKSFYAASAEETDFVPTVRRSGDTVRAFITLRPKPGMRFNVAMGYPGGCVTTGLIRKGTALHNISIASDSCDSAAHSEAVSAIFGAAD